MISRLELSHFNIIPAEVCSDIELGEGSEMKSGTVDLDVRVVDGHALVTEVMKGTFELVNMGVKADITVYSQNSNKVHSILKSDVLGEAQNGVTDDVLWELSFMLGPKVKEGLEKENAIRDATFNRFVYWKKNYKTADCTGIDSVKHEECYKVVLIPESGFPYTIYINKKSNLITKAETVIEHQMGQIPLEIYIDDYQRVGDISIAHKVTAKVMNQERIITTKSIKQKVEFPEGIFQLPEDIKELVASQDSEQ